MSAKSYNLDVYIGNVAGGRNALLRIWGPLIGLVKNGRGVNREVITNGNDAADDKMVLEFKTLMDSISPAYFTWTNGKNFSDIGGKQRSIRFLLKDNMIVNQHENARNNYESFQYNEEHMIKKVLRAFRNVEEGDENTITNQITGRHPVEVSMFTWAAIFLDWKKAGASTLKEYFLEMISSCFENDELQLVLDKCFRRASLTKAVSSTAEILKNVESECESKVSYLTAGVNKCRERPIKKEHVCGTVCHEKHETVDFDPDAVLQEEPLIAEAFEFIMKRRATEQIVKENVDDTVREARRKAGYIAMIKDVEDINRFKCPYCKPEKEKDPDSDDHIFDFSVDKDNDEDLKPLRTCVQCRQEYHVNCRKALKHKCMLCGFVGGEEESDEESELDDDDSGGLSGENCIIDLVDDVVEIDRDLDDMEIDCDVDVIQKDRDVDVIQKDRDVDVIQIDDDDDVIQIDDDDDDDDILAVADDEIPVDEADDDILDDSDDDANDYSEFDANFDADF